jgi:hypothetical protein
MDVLGTLPVWAQLLIVFLVAGVLVVMNLGWLIQARGWLDRQKQQRSGDQTGAGTGPASAPPPTAPERDG